MVAVCLRYEPQFNRGVLWCATKRNMFLFICYFEEKKTIFKRIEILNFKNTSDQFEGMVKCMVLKNSMCAICTAVQSKICRLMTNVHWSEYYRVSEMMWGEDECGGLNSEISSWVCGKCFLQCLQCRHKTYANTIQCQWAALNSLAWTWTSLALC